MIQKNYRLQTQMRLHLAYTKISKGLNMNKILILFSWIFLLAACGFEPLYAKKQNSNAWYFSGNFDNSVTHEMSQISIEPIGERYGQQVRNQLLDLVTPLGSPKTPKYRLYVTPKPKQVTQQAMRQDITATRERIKYEVSYYLEQNDKNILNGNSISFVSYNILSNPYSTTTAQKKTEEDAAKIIANDIALRLGAYFHKELHSKGSY